ncbi:MAG: dTDP-4-dehydrorhamnose 3,5-epimerase family protein [Parachlamydiaceae bacterium]
MRNFDFESVMIKNNQDRQKEDFFSDLKSSINKKIPQGVILEKLSQKADARGSFVEIFRETWSTAINPVQWNIIKSHANCFRGVHVHIKHDDYLVPLSGKTLIGLQDLRIKSPTYGIGCVVELNGEDPARLTIPPGVAHAFYCTDTSTLIHAVSEYWDPHDELRCHWQSPELKIPWTIENAIVSECDANAPSFKQLVDTLKPWQDTLL